MVTDDKQPIRVIIEARVSTTDQVSTQAQIDDISKNMPKGRVIVQIVQEEHSGKEREGVYDPIAYMKLRPKFYNEVYLPATRKEYEELWIWRYDRLARSDLTQTMIRMFNDLGVKVLALRDSNEPLVVGIKNVLSKEETRVLVERVELRHQELLKKKRVLNRPPLGYKFKRHKLVVDESNKEAVLEMFRLTIDGVPPKEICSRIKILVGVRLKQKKGNPKHKIKTRKMLIELPLRTYKRCLTNRTYEGIYMFRGEERKGNYPTPYKELFLKAKEVIKNEK